MNHRCACGEKNDRYPQRRCKRCHAADMKLRRRHATERGTNTIAGATGIRRTGAAGAIEAAAVSR